MDFLGLLLRTTPPVWHWKFAQKSVLDVCSQQTATTTSRKISTLLIPTLLMSTILIPTLLISTPLAWSLHPWSLHSWSLHSLSLQLRFEQGLGLAHFQNRLDLTKSVNSHGYEEEDGKMKQWLGCSASVRARKEIFGRADLSCVWTWCLYITTKRDPGVRRD